jgi:hypothetical protein
MPAAAQTGTSPDDTNRQPLGDAIGQTLKFAPIVAKAKGLRRDHYIKETTHA